MTNANETFDEEYEDYDAFEDDEEERGLSGLVVLLMGVVMICAFFAVVWIAYQQGIKTGQNGLGAETPYVAADPEPIKIETAGADGDAAADREVYDAFDGDAEEPVTVLAEGPEEPVSRDSADPIGALAADAGDAPADAAAEDLSDAVESRLASLAAEDAALFEDAEPQSAPAVPARAPSRAPAREAARPTPASASSQSQSPQSSQSATTPTAASVTPARMPASGPLSGTHLVQVGAFRSNEEAAAQWSRMEARLGDYLEGKLPDVERADLGARGVYHRLRVGPFASSEDARRYCAGLKERGQDCLVKSI